MCNRKNVEVYLVQQLELPADAVAYLMTVWDMSQLFDDWVDGADVDRDDQDSLIWLSLVDLPTQPFLREHANSLLPIMANIVLKWKASDTVERKGEQFEKAYMWRAGYYDLVLQVVCLVYGPEVALKAGEHVSINVWRVFRRLLRGISEWLTHLQQQ